MLRGAAQVVVATPGRLWDLMKLGQAHITDLSSLSFLVIDEADRMVQQGHYQVWEAAVSMSFYRAPSWLPVQQALKIVVQQRH